MKKHLCAAAFVLFAVVPFAAHAAPCDLADGADANRALLSAAGKGDAKHVRCLLDEGADANVADSAGNTALMRVARFGNEGKTEGFPSLAATRGAGVAHARRARILWAELENVPAALAQISATSLGSTGRRVAT